MGLDHEHALRRARAELVDVHARLEELVDYLAQELVEPSALPQVQAFFDRADSCFRDLERAQRDLDAALRAAGVEIPADPCAPLAMRRFAGERRAR